MAQLADEKVQAVIGRVVNRWILGHKQAIKIKTGENTDEKVFHGCPAGAFFRTLPRPN